MKFESLDDYYLWTCDWCDSENRTLWVKVAQGGAWGLPPERRHHTRAGGPKRNGRIMAGLC